MLYMPSIFFYCLVQSEIQVLALQNGVANLTFSCNKSGYCGTGTKPGKDRWFRNIICDRNRAARSDLLVTYGTRDSSA
jgi:hypothetical protein